MPFDGARLLRAQSMKRHTLVFFPLTHGDGIDRFTAILLFMWTSPITLLNDSVSSGK